MNAKAAPGPAPMPLKAPPVEPRPAPPGLQAYRLNAPMGGTVRFAHWRPPHPPGVGAALVLPGLGEFVEKYHETVQDLLDRGWSVFVLDWFGQGLSTRALANRQKVHVPDFRRYLSDLDKLVETALPPHSDMPRLLLAHSMGGHLALRHLFEHPRSFDVAVLSSPMVDLDYGPLPRLLARGQAEAACALGLGRNYLFGAGDYDPKRARFQGNRLTHDRRRFFDQHAWIARRPKLAVGGPTFAWLRAAQHSIRATERRGFGRGVKIPVLVMAAEQERRVSVAATQRLARAIPNAAYIGIADARHEILMETDEIRALFWQRVDGFLRQCGMRRAA
ncbi:MAG: alpha/beta fold hydrolase [Rhodospirillales bacterium]